MLVVARWMSAISTVPASLAVALQLCLHPVHTYVTATFQRVFWDATAAVPRTAWSATVTAASSSGTRRPGISLTNEGSLAGWTLVRAALQVWLPGEVGATHTAWPSVCLVVLTPECSANTTQLKALKKTAAADGSLVVSSLLGLCLLVALVVRTAKVRSCRRPCVMLLLSTYAACAHVARVNLWRHRRCCLHCLRCSALARA